MADFRIPRGYGKVSWPFQTRFENGTTPSYPVRPANFLPVWTLDEVQDDPIVLPPGTFVGRLNDRDHTTVPDIYLNGEHTPLVPACPNAYVVTYGSMDVDTFTIVGGTPDLDSSTGAVVTATGDSTTNTGAAVKPLGIIARPYYAGWLRDRYYNYDPYLQQTWISGMHIVRIPCITSAEASIEAGDLVKLTDAATPKWNPSDLTTSPAPGRIHAFDGGAVADMEYVVGRCVNKVLLGKQAAISAGEALSTAIGTAAPQTLANIDTTATYLWPEGENFQVQSKTEGVPGLQLSGTSATLGRPAEMMYARADASGLFWALDIYVNV